MRRPDDLLVFDLIFGGVVFKTDPPRLERSSDDAYVIVEFPPQSFGEEAFLEVDKQKFEPAPDPKAEPMEVTSNSGYPDKNVEGGGDETTATALPLARVRMAQPSRVGVTMPAGTSAIGYDLASVLRALAEWPMRLDVNASADPATLIGPLGNLVEPPLSGPVTVMPMMSSGEAQSQLQIQALATTATIDPGSSPLGSTSIDPHMPLLPIVFGPHEPGPTVTALELPYRLITSPIAPARWRHAPAPVTRRGRTELWHTRLTTGGPTGPDEASRIRALWSPDYRPKDEIDELIDLITAPTEPPDPPEPNPDLIRMSLDPVDRSMLVALMAGFDERTDSGATYRPVSSEAKRLHLSALGALLDVEGNWTSAPDYVDLQEWRHLATLGRDHYVRVMYAGYLCPFRHAASLVKVTERKFESLGSKPAQRIALLRQRFFVVVREPVRQYSGAGHTFHGNNFPFTRVEILTRVTPDLSEPGIDASALAPEPATVNLYSDGVAPRMLFWPMVPGPAGPLVDVPFEIAVTDIAGNRSTFSMPLLFVGKVADAKKSAAVKASYNKAPADPKRCAFLGGSVVAYAPSSPADKGDPKLPTKSITFKAGDLTATGKPNFYPEIDVAQVGIKPIQKLLSQPGFISEVAYPDFYNQHGFSATENSGQLFLKLTAAKPLTFGGDGQAAKSDSLGALASPQMQLLGLSKVMGPVGGKDAGDRDAVEDALKTVKGGSFDPKDFFDEAKILGGVSLSDLLTTKNNLSGDDVPKMLSRDFPDRVESSFDWSTEISQSDGLKLLIPRADTDKPPSQLAMHGIVRAPRDPATPPSVEATATVNNFKVNLFGFIILWFEELSFVSKNGQKPDVTVRLRDGDDAVQFGGPLEFVNGLRNLIPGNGFSDPPGLTVTPSGIAASYSLTLPAVEVGIFALSNASLGAAFNLPFDSTPASVKFSFSKRESPFSLTVSLLGGGGFFLIGVSARGVNEIEAALEFGAVVAIDLGVASGSVEIKAGVYFHWLEPEPDKGSVELAGYVRIHGELTVIAIISVSLTFNLQLGYLKQGGTSTVYGEATLTVEIEILMFSAEVSVSCRREFAGSAADPTFIDQMPTAEKWAEYCGAFAAEPA